MNSTSPSPRLVRIAARSPARSIAGPLVIRIGGAQLGGDDHRQGGLAEPGRAGQQDVVGRAVAPHRALSSTSWSCSRTFGWPTNSASRLGRRLASTSRSSSAGEAGPRVAHRADRLIPAGPVPRSPSGPAPLAAPVSRGRAGANVQRGKPPSPFGGSSGTAAAAAASGGWPSGWSAATTSTASTASLPEKPSPARACASWSRQGETAVSRPRECRGVRAVDRADADRAVPGRSARRPCGRCPAPWSARRGRWSRRRGAARAAGARPASPAPASGRRRSRSAAARTGPARRRRRTRTASASPRGRPGWWPAARSRRPAAAPACPASRTRQPDPADLDDRAVGPDAATGPRTLAIIGHPRPPDRADGRPPRAASRACAAPRQDVADRQRERVGGVGRIRGLGRAAAAG